MIEKSKRAEMNARSQPSGLSWNTHALLTWAALERPNLPGFETRFPVMALENFLAEVGHAIEPIIAMYWKLLDRKLKHGAPEKRSVPAVDTVDQFFEAFRLNLEPGIAYVRILRPDEVPADTPHDPSRLGPPGGSYLETPVDARVSPQEVLCTFSDEPDWGMDQGLFRIEQYGFGSAPYGDEAGTSSQAPFHMAFFYENPLAVIAYPNIRLNFMEERIRVFLDLARLAFSKRLYYWGWRFTAWAMHYVQDLTQPYHARAFPVSIFRVLLRVLTSGGFMRAAAKNVNLLKNRHILFEATVHFILNDAFKKGVPDSPLIEALANAGESEPGTVRAVMMESAKTASHLVSAVNESLVDLMADPRMDDPAYSLEEDATYRIDEILPDAALKRPQAFERFMELVSRCFYQTGKVTRLAARRACEWQGKEQ